LDSRHSRISDEECAVLVEFLLAGGKVLRPGDTAAFLGAPNIAITHYVIGYPSGGWSLTGLSHIRDVIPLLRKHNEKTILPSV
jgi:hypothetical protein